MMLPGWIERICLSLSNGDRLYVDSWDDSRQWPVSITDYGPPRPCTCCPWQPQSRHLEVSPAHVVTAEKVMGSWES